VIRSLVLALLVFAGGAVAAHAPQALATDAVLPALKAKTLAGSATNLPVDGKGRGALLVTGFSRASADATRPWLEACRTATASKPAPTRAACYDVRMLADVPWLLRGLVERGMRSGLPADLQKTVLLVYEDNDAWRKRVGFAEPDTAYLVAVDKDGRVKASAKGAHTQKELERLLALIQ